MNNRDAKYTRYSLAKEMLQTAAVISRFNCRQAHEAASALRRKNKIFFTGEGSSRIFPAKHFIYQALQRGLGLAVNTDGSRQAAEYDLTDYVVFGASNSGKTKEVVGLFRDLKDDGHDALFSLSAFADTPLAAAAHRGYVLGCGKEEAVAATKSVVEQALFYHALLDQAFDFNELADRLPELGELADETLNLAIDPAVVKQLAGAEILHWAGRNTGVAEELTLKTNEITRKRSAYLEGTYAVHGIEEVMSPGDAVIVVEPFEAEEEKFSEVLEKGVGCTVVAIASRPTRFPTIQIPECPGLDCYLRLLAGWNLLVEIGCALDINLDKPQRARKVGNELVE